MPVGSLLEDLQQCMRWFGYANRFSNLAKQQCALQVCIAIIVLAAMFPMCDIVGQFSCATIYVDYGCSTDSNIPAKK